MIKKFNIFEQISDIDPYGEENWNDNNITIGDFVKLKHQEDAYYQFAPHWGNYYEGWLDSKDPIGFCLGAVIRFNDIEGIPCVVTSGFGYYRLDCVEKMK